jgi:23S rRNA-/tRNA-specific pseudouridylate synthase
MVDPKPQKQRTAGEPKLDPRQICTVVHQDEHLVVVDKHAGFPVAPSAQYQQRSVLRALVELGLGHCNPVSLFDREASGLVLLSRDASTARSLRWHWRSPGCERRYIAVAQGDIAGARGRITFPIGMVQVGRRRRRGVLPVDQGGKPAETRWRLLARGRGMSRLLLTMEGDRCHQARIHLAAVGHPLVNERSYLERNTQTPMDSLLEDLDHRRRDIRKLPAHQIALHLWQVELEHPVFGDHLALEAPIPRELLDLMPGAWIVDTV